MRYFLGVNVLFVKKHREPKEGVYNHSFAERHRFYSSLNADSVLHL